MDDTTTPLAADMTPAEIAAMYNDKFSDMKSAVRERLPFLPRISLTHPKTTNKQKKGVEVGDWYLTPGDTAQGEEPKYENLGKKFECIVLHDSLQLSMRSDEGKTLMETTEFQSYQGTPLFMLDARSGPLHVIAVAPYSGKQAVHTMADLRNNPDWPRKPTKDGSGMVSSVSFDFNVYVLLTDGRIAVLQNSKRGHFGTDTKTGESLDFKNVADNSYVRCRATCHDMTPGLTLAHRWAVGSVQVSDADDEPRPAFKILGIGDPAKASLIREKADELSHYLHQKWSDRLGYAWQNTSPAQREQMITAYGDVRRLLDAPGGHEVAAAITLGKKPAPALLAEPEPDYAALDAGRKQEEGSKIDALRDEVEDARALPHDVVDANVVSGAAGGSMQTPDISYGSDIKVEDLPF